MLRFSLGNRPNFKIFEKLVRGVLKHTIFNHTLSYDDITLKSDSYLTNTLYVKILQIVEWSSDGLFVTDEGVIWYKQIEYAKNAGWIIGFSSWK